MTDHLRQRLVAVALEWEREFVNAPSITSVISEYDASEAVLIQEAFQSPSWVNGD